MPGFRSGAYDVWGVGLASDSHRNCIMVSGGERNRLIYLYEIDHDRWKVFRIAVYDGGWGASIEYVQSRNALFQIDGRNGTNTQQGTAVLLRRFLPTGYDGLGSVSTPPQFHAY
ncbi:MAG: hypothetical protein ABIK28_05380 [Planctomycetota bacterium]